MKLIRRIFIHGALAATLTLMLTPVVNAASDNDEASLHALVTEAMNPVGMMVKVPLQNNFDFGVGPNKVTQYTLDLEPIIPITLNEDWNLIARAVIPIISQPSTGPGEPNVDGLGDINPSIFLSPAKSHGHFWGIGPTFTLPTGTSPQLTSGQWSVGPAAVYLATPGPWMIGAFASQQWSVGGWSDRNVNLTTIQPMIIYHLPKGWYLVSIPVITANWEADANDRWTVPVGGGVGKIVKVGKMPLNLQVQAFYNVERPRDSSNWQFRFQMLFLFPE